MNNKNKYKFCHGEKLEVAAKSMQLQQVVCWPFMPSFLQLKFALMEKAGCTSSKKGLTSAPFYHVDDLLSTIIRQTINVDF